MLARKATLVVFNDVVGSVLGLVALFFIARELNAYVLGMIGFGLAFVQLYGILSNLGYGKAHVKRVSEGKDLGRCIGTYIAIKAGLLVLFNVALFTSLFFWTDVFGKGFESTYHLTIVYIMALWFNLEAVSQIFLTTYNGRLEIAKAQIPRIVGNTIRLVGTIYVAITVVAKEPRMYDAAIPIAWTYVIAAAVQLALALYFFRGYPLKRPDRAMFLSYTKYALPAMIMTSMVIITINTDKVMIQAFWSSSRVGFYSAAQRIAFVIVFLTNAIASVLLPSISRHHVRGERKEVVELIAKAERYVIMIALPPIVLFFTLPDRIILILSGKFEAAGPILQILSIWALIAVINTPYRNLIQGYDRPGIMAKVSILQASLNVMLNLVFIPAALFGIPLFGWSAVGAALATLITQVVLFFIVRWYAYRLSGVRSSPRNIVFVIGALAMFVSLLAMDSLVPAERWFHLAAYGLIGLFVYIATLASVRQFTRKDLSFFLEAVHPKEMFSYVKDEITKRGVDDDEPPSGNDERPGGSGPGDRGGVKPDGKGTARKARRMARRKK